MNFKATYDEHMFTNPKTPITEKDQDFLEYVKSILPEDFTLHPDVHDNINPFMKEYDAYIAHKTINGKKRDGTVNTATMYNIINYEQILYEHRLIYTNYIMKELTDKFDLIDSLYPFNHTDKVESIRKDEMEYNYFIIILSNCIKIKNNNDHNYIINKNTKLTYDENYSFYIVDEITLAPYEEKFIDCIPSFESIKKPLEPKKLSETIYSNIEFELTKTIPVNNVNKKQYYRSINMLHFNRLIYKKTTSIKTIDQLKEDLINKNIEDLEVRIPKRKTKNIIPNLTSGEVNIQEYISKVPISFFNDQSQNISIKYIDNKLLSVINELDSKNNEGSYEYIKRIFLS